VRVLLCLLFAAHGLIHLMGPAKAFGFAELPQLTQPVSRTAGILWVLAAMAMVAAAGAVFLWPRGWWAVGLVAITLSQAAIVTSWSDARFGTLANAALLAGIVFSHLWRRAPAG
jgi:hypothetical protein